MSDLATAIAELNRRRLRVLGPLMIVLHVLHVIFFHVPPSLRATLAPATLRWRDDLVLAHGATLPFVVVLTLLAYRLRRPSLVALLGPATALVYLVHGAICAGVDQIVSTNISAYIGYCIGLAVILSLPPRVSIPVYLVGAATMLVSLWTFQQAGPARLTNLPTSVTVALVSVAVSWMLDRNRRRDLVQRATIDRQRDELAALNAGLEQRVRDQVREIVARADEVERLNAQLQAQVRARSVELSLALTRLAERRESDGTLALGSVLGDRFRVDAPIGKGGMGTVYRGVDNTTGARVAIKVIQATSSSQLDAMRRFIREAGAAATVTHPAVVRMLHVDVSDDGLLYQAQELVDGETLARLVGKRVWPAATVARIGAVLCDALAAAHALGVVHRDVKPDNVMLVPAAPGLKLLDFGIAKLYDSVARPGSKSDGKSDGETPRVTEARMVVGTPGFMAPEQAHGRDVGDRADVYAAGVLLHQLATAPPHDLDGEAPGAPADFAAILRRCRAFRPADRPSAAEVARALTVFADGEKTPPLEALVPALLEAAVEKPRSHSAIPTTPQRRTT